MYFVVECMTMSAPSASGCCSSGVANVLSTTVTNAGARAIAAQAAMSVIRSSGFDGVSSQSSFVSGRMAASIVGEVAGVDEGEVDAELREELREDAPRAAVEVLRGDDVIAGAEEREHVVDGGHAAGKREPVSRALERGEVLFERAARGVLGARVARSRLLTPGSVWRKVEVW